MNKQTKHLISPRQLEEEFPLSENGKNFIEQSRTTICQIICGNDPRTLLIVGPCSVHDIEMAKVYARRLKKLQDELNEVFFIVMRVYFEKPRTKAGWKGLLYDPFLDGSDQIELGLKFVRKLLLDITEIGLPIASEIVEPLAFYYLENLLSWICIGARTVSSQIHRQIASSFTIPVAFKNDTEGNLKSAVNSIVASDTAHSFFGIDDTGEIAHITSRGNPFGHVVLRGGGGKPNYHREAVQSAIKIMEEEGLLPRIIIDCSHDNCNKDLNKMSEVFRNVIEQIAENEMIRGVMFESYLEGGNQPMKKRSELKPTISITDPCLDWESTVSLVTWAHQLLKEKIKIRP